MDRTTELEKNIRKLGKTNSILLMTHMVMGFPNFDENEKALTEMYQAGVRFIELQIPFSEPIADGPVISRACQKAIDNKVSFQDCISFAYRMADKFPEISFLIMSYTNPLFQNDIGECVRDGSRNGILGWIIPDLPPEESGEYLAAARETGSASVFIFTPYSKDSRLKLIDENSSGFIYCVGRPGVTGKKTEFSTDTDDIINRYKKFAHLPLGFGFGVNHKSHIEFLRGKTEIAIIGSAIINILSTEGSSGVGKFLNEIIS